MLSYKKLFIFLFPFSVRAVVDVSTLGLPPDITSHIAKEKNVSSHLLRKKALQQRYYPQAYPNIYHLSKAIALSHTTDGGHGGAFIEREQSVIEIAVVDDLTRLAFMKKDQQLISKFTSIDPNFCTSIESLINSDNALEYYQYLRDVESQNISQYKEYNTHVDRLYESLLEEYQSSSNKTDMTKDLHFNMDDVKRVRLIDVTHAPHNLRVRLYTFSCGFLNARISLGGQHITPQICWHCHEGIENCTLDESNLSFRKMSFEELFQFLIVLQRHKRISDTGILSAEQQVLKDAIFDTIPEHLHEKLVVDDVSQEDEID